MQTFEGVDNFSDFNKSKIALTIGNFDGVHAGHRFLLQQLKQEADILKIPTVVLTFKEHTSRLTRPQSVKNLVTLEQKSDLISETSLIDYLILQDFTQSFMNLGAVDFVTDVLVKKLNIGLIMVGQNHRFGKNRQGDIDLLSTMSNIHGFKTVALELYKLNGEVVSSTSLRREQA